MSNKRCRNWDDVDDKFAHAKASISRCRNKPNAKYVCKTDAGHLVVVNANVNDSIEEIMKLAAEKHNIPVCDVIQEHRFTGAEDADERDPTDTAS